MNYSQCIKTYRPDFYLDRGVDHNSMVCAGGYDLNKDTCNVSQDLNVKPQIKIYFLNLCHYVFRAIREDRYKL